MPFQFQKYVLAIFAAILLASSVQAVETEIVPPNRAMGIRNPMPAPLPVARALHQEPISESPPAEVAALQERPNPLPLPKRTEKTTAADAIPTFKLQGSRMASIAASLFVVVGLFLIFAWVGKKNIKPGSGRLSKEIIQVLGKSQLAGKQQLELVRVGKKLLLLCVTPHSVETLTEITDPVEVERLLGIVREDSPGSTSETFQQVLTQLSSQPTRGFLEA